MIYLINTHPLVPSTVPGFKGKDKTVREDILESVKRLTKDDCLDICVTFGLSEDKANKTSIRKYALADEDIAEYLLLF